METEGLENLCAKFVVANLLQMLQNIEPQRAMKLYYGINLNVPNVGISHVVVNHGRKNMIDLDIYIQNPEVENFLEQLKSGFKKDNHTIKIYISTASQNDNWLQKLYTIYNEDEVDK